MPWRAGPAAAAAIAVVPASAASDGTGTAVAALIGGALLMFAVAGLVFVLRRRTRSGGGRRRNPTDARAAEPGGDRSGGSSMPGTSGARTGPADGPDSRYEDRSSWMASANEPGWPYPDHPSWPAGSTGRPLTPDHPSWPANDLGRPIGYGRHDEAAPDFPYGDHPSWPASSPGRPVRSDDYPSWPAADPGGWWAASTGAPPRDLAGEPPPATVHHDPYPQRPAPRVPPARGRHMRAPAGYSGSPRPGVPPDDTPERWSAQLARNAGPIPQTYYDLAFGHGRLPVVLTEAPGGDPGRAAGPGARSGHLLQLPGPGTPGQPVSWDTGEYGNADPVRVAERVLAGADQQAAAIRQEAASQAAAIREAAERESVEIRRQTAADAAPIREGAEREAAEILQQAEAQAAAIREAAEREAAELRAHLTAMAAEMAQVAAYVTESLTSPGLSAVPPPRQAGPPTLTAPVELPVEPAAAAAIQPAARPGTAPRTRPRTRPATRPAARPRAQPKTRQYKAMRLTSVAAAALVLFTAVAGSAEVGLHGFKFFVFRAAGTGATNGDGLDENQGPGQPDAPGAHRKAQHQQAAKAKSHGKAHRQHGKAHQQHGKAHQEHGKAHQAKPAKKN